MLYLIFFAIVAFDALMLWRAWTDFQVRPRTGARIALIALDIFLILVTIPALYVVGVLSYIAFTGGSFGP